MTDWYSGTPTVPRAYRGESLISPYDSDAFIHPSIIHVPGGWNGYEYWLGITPYDTEPHENPCVYCSHDMRHWETPSGMTNPLAEWPGGIDQNSDADIFITSDNIMCCVWGRAENPGLFMRTSTDGATWTAEETIWHDGQILVVIPSAIWTGSKWRIYFVSGERDGLYYWEKTSANGTLAEFRAGGWPARSAATRVDGLPQPLANTRFNHIRVHKSGVEYHLFGALIDGASGYQPYTYLGGYFSTSSDGLTWQTPKAVMPRRTDLIFDPFFYVMDGVVVGNRYRILYTPLTPPRLAYSEMNLLGDATLRPWEIEHTLALPSGPDIPGLVGAYSVRADGSFTDPISGNAATLSGPLVNVRPYSSIRTGGVGYVADFGSVTAAVPTDRWNPAAATIFVVRGVPGDTGQRWVLHWAGYGSSVGSYTMSPTTQGCCLWAQPRGVLHLPDQLPWTAGAGVEAWSWGDAGTKPKVYNNAGASAEAESAVAGYPSEMDYLCYVGNNGTVGTTSFNGPIQSIVVFDRQLTDSEVATVQAALLDGVDETLFPSVSFDLAVEFALATVAGEADSTSGAEGGAAEVETAAGEAGSTSGVLGTATLGGWLAFDLAVEFALAEAVAITGEAASGSEAEGTLTGPHIYLGALTGASRISIDLDGDGTVDITLGGTSEVSSDLEGASACRT